MPHQEQKIRDLERENAELRARVAQLEPSRSAGGQPEAQDREGAGLRTLIDATTDIAALIDQDGTFIQVNQSMADALDLTVSELIGTCAYDLFSAEVAERRKRKNDEAMQLGVPIRYEEEERGVIYEISIFPLEPDLFALFGRDITEARRAERRQLERAEIFRAVSESAVDAIFCKDLERRYTLANPAMERLLGLSAAEIVGKRADEIFGEEAMEAINQADDPAFEGRANSGTWPLDLGGVLHHFHVVEVPLLDQDGQVWGICGIVRDISDLKRSEQALKQKQFLVESASSVIATADLDGNMTYANPMFLGTWGFDSFDEVRGRPFPDFWLVGDLLDEIMATLMDEGRWFGEAQARRKDGSLFDVQVMAAAIKDHAGNIVGLMSSSIDITERKQAEHDLALQAADLSRSNEELEQFAYVASHDLQEPLRMVASFSQIISERYSAELSADAARYFQYVQEGACRMQALIDGVLALSRVGTHGKAMVRVDMTAVSREVQANLRQTIQESGAEFLEHDLPAVIADRTQLIQLLQNLMANAIKFRGDRRPRVELSAVRKGQFWQFTLQDNGIGIEARYHDRIFRMFQRLHTRSEYEGNGIGLALARKIIERHGGDIQVESTPEEGTRFIFTLPAADDPA